MGKVFNVTAACTPEEHYMVNIDRRLIEIKAVVDGRIYDQWGKTIWKNRHIDGLGIVFNR